MKIKEAVIMKKTSNELLLDFKRLLSFQKMSENTERTYFSVIRGFLNSSDTIDADSVLKWASRVSQFQKISTVSLYYSAMRRFLSFSNPEVLAEVKDRLKVKGHYKPIPRALSEEQLSRLWRRAVKAFDEDPRFVLIVGLCGYAGLRVSELRNLRLRDISIAENAIRVNGKGQKMRVIPIPRNVKPFLAEVVAKSENENNFIVTNKRGGQLTGQGITLLLHKLATKVGVDNISPHMLRHTAATRLLYRGVNIRIIQEFLGHSSLATTQRYLKVTAQDIKESLRKAKY